MTFLEAAIEVLREADGPLHFGEVARRAVEGNLLSHVGRDPEAAMRSCLMSAVRTGHSGEEPIIVRE
ncbi:MAG: winged helix-turn-helix domain-containing protein, partial [Myxococcales bacterium]|nr:winged helix-turn-helix domain-containing protein [Myxococcales bacterium]